MKCEDARHLIHLSVGDDTLPEEEARLSEHLHKCSDCRAYNAGMVDAMHAIELSRETISDEVVDSPSLWPSIENRISDRIVQRQPVRKKFSGGVAALCACSLTLALVTIVQNLPVNSTIEDPSLAIPVMNVNYSHQPQGQFQQPVGVLRVVNPDGSTAGYVQPTMLQEIPVQQAPPYQIQPGPNQQTSF